MLKYLFKAEFTDGTFIQQTQEDVSLLKNGRNQWYDVVNIGKPVRRLTYYEQKFWNPTVISVDLNTGLFELNGKQVFTEEIKTKKGEPVIIKSREPIRYMNVKQHASATYNTKTGGFTNVKGAGEERIFYIGWESGNYRQVIGVK